MMRYISTRLTTVLSNFDSNYADLLAYLDDFSLHDWRSIDEIDLDQALSILGIGYHKGKNKNTKIRMLKEEVERRANGKRR